VRSTDQTSTTERRRTELLHEASMLRHRAESLRHQAESLDEVLAVTYRRRASELEMSAWVLEVQAGLPDEQVHPAA
jgi:hypothetical protein